MISKIKIILHNGADSHVFEPIKVEYEFYNVSGSVIAFETKTERITSSLPFEVIYEK